MEIKALIEKLFGNLKTEDITVVDNWKQYTLEPGYATTMRLEELQKQFRVFGYSNTGEKLIISGGVYVVIQHPPFERRSEPTLLSIREDNLRPAFLNDMSDDEDFERNRTNPKLAYGYIFREQFELDKLKPWAQTLTALMGAGTFKQHEADPKAWTFKQHEADPKAWTLIESTMFNKQDTVPQIRNSFKPYTQAEAETGSLTTFPSGFIGIDKYGYLTIAMDYRVATGALADIKLGLEGDAAGVENLIKKLRTEIIAFEGQYYAFEEKTLETSLFSSIGNSI